MIFTVTWFAALFYLPRLFVYHAMTSDAATSERFKVMERKLGVMMDIGATLTMVFGFWLLFSYGWSQYKHNGWLHVKLTAGAPVLRPQVRVPVGNRHVPHGRKPPP